MPTRHTHRFMHALGGAIAAISLIACSSGNGNGNGSMRVGADGTSEISGDALQTQLSSMPVTALSPTEEAGLMKMREEELLAHDVYVELSQQWDVQVFDNISAAEQTHADAVAALLSRHDLTDPAAAHVAGEFTDPAIQALYIALVEQGSTSLVAALTVGATVEDLDIADLQSLATTTPDVALVYANLERGSRNHLRAFTRQLERNGSSYTPTYISDTEYQAILAGDMERGPTG